ncbi:MAG TPA: aldehyde ferredoxin oxidoreductase C-terminal domain-containing protein [candidate division Zixibacteria bacterium]|nr:aldehyde ferredoxin oxidoreductase C-terminal domain-containing protein [candidate division Zixibacteria bacterium]
METWRVNVRSHTLSREPVKPTWEMLGGRGLLARIIIDEVKPTCDPLGPDNKLIFAPGLLVGHMLSSCDRISVGGKSPLTGGIKESNAGGRTGLHLTHLGIKVLILEGTPKDGRNQILHLGIDGASFEPAIGLDDTGVYEAAESLIERYGKNVAIALIGIGGEYGLTSAGIQNIDKDRVPSRINARGGLGAVMGSKGLKAIVIDKEGGEKPEVTHPEEFKRAHKAYNKALMSHPQTTVYHDYGTAAMTLMCNGFGAMPTRNFSAGEFEGAEAISGEYMREELLRREGASKISHACMAGCTILCSNVFGGEDGQVIVSPLEYETIGLMGANLGIDSLDTIARMNWVVNDLGLDSIEVGAALGVAAEAGLWEFGDGDKALALLEEIREGTPLGRVLGHGAAVTGRVFGVQRVPVVKGQAMSAYEPRAIKGTGVTYATSPQGADHTAGLTIRAKIDHLDPKGQVDLSRSAQINSAGYDTLGACSFAGFGFAAAPETIRDLLNARYGWDIGDGILQELGRETLLLEREFNRLAGFTPADDRLPEWMAREPLAPHNAVFDVSDEELDGLFDWDE